MNAQPSLLRGSRSDVLWQSVCTAINEKRIYIRIVAATCEGWGPPIKPHLFLDSAATGILIDYPAHTEIDNRTVLSTDVRNGIEHCLTLDVTG